MVSMVLGSDMTEVRIPTLSQESQGHAHTRMHACTPPTILSSDTIKYRSVTSHKCIHWVVSVWPRMTAGHQPSADPACLPLPPGMGATRAAAAAPGGRQGWTAGCGTAGGTGVPATGRYPTPAPACVVWCKYVCLFHNPELHQR